VYNTVVRNFSDKTAYISGGSSGIGLEIARLLRAEGATVVLIARNQSRLDLAHQTLLADIAVPTQAPVFTLALDVSDRNAISTVIPAVVRDVGEPDLLINCAGTSLPGYFHLITQDDLQESMRVNFEGTWNMIQALLPWIRSRRGHIVNVSSVAGLVGSFGYSAYAASKFAVTGLTEVLRNELIADGVRVSLLCPPDTDTPQLAQENLRKPPETAAISRGAGMVAPRVVATACLNGIRSGRFLILVGAESRFIYLLKRLAPALLYFVMDRIVRKQRCTHHGAGKGKEKQ
jgi:3-dehydrosphinganine reductase